MTVKGCESIANGLLVFFFRLTIKTNIKHPHYGYWPVDSLTDDQNVFTYRDPIVMPTAVWCETIYKVSIMTSMKMVSRKYVSSKFWWHHLIRYSWHVSENRWFTPLIIVVHLMNQPVSIPDSDKTYHKICVYFVKDNYFNLSCSVSWQYQTLPQLFLIYMTMLCSL